MSNCFLNCFSGALGLKSTVRKLKGSSVAYVYMASNLSKSTSAPISS